MGANVWIFRLGMAATVLTLCVVILGAYVRLSHAGLGCPDWPGCYGHLNVPKSDAQIARANEVWPDRPVESAKAWKEMIHRYFAGALGLLTFAIAAIAMLNRREGVSIKWPSVLVVLLIFQALLGMWTVTLLLKPLVVTAHLLGGMITLALLWWVTLRHSNWHPLRYYSVYGLQAIKIYGLVCFATLMLQIALGGWTSTNYAALACHGFPQCNFLWWPQMDFSEAFVLWRGLGIDYEGGVLDHPARVAIHMAHRIGAVVISVMLLILIIAVMIKAAVRPLKLVCLLLLLMLLVQLGLGVTNVTKGLPLLVAVAHNGGAAVLILILLTMIFMLTSHSEELA
jgi:cytochrome c oxidase assembly protein subunit 15